MSKNIFVIPSPQSDDGEQVERIAGGKQPTLHGLEVAGRKKPLVSLDVKALWHGGIEGSTLVSLCSEAVAALSFHEAPD